MTLSKLMANKAARHGKRLERATTWRQAGLWSVSRTWLRPH